MSRANHLRTVILCACGMLLLSGCLNTNPGSQTLATSGTTTSGGNTSTVPTTGGPVARITQPSIYVADYRNQIQVFAQPVSGSSLPYLQITGSDVSVDGMGNIYVVIRDYPNSFNANTINIYSPDSPTEKPLRSLPVGPGTKISAVKTMAVSPSGEIFVNDGKGIAVFGPTANGNADPVRYILGNTQSGGDSSTSIIPDYYIAVDSSDNVYVQQSGSQAPRIVVFGPKDSGTVVPSRMIVGPLTQLSGWIDGLSTDAAGNLYVLCYCGSADGLNPYRVLEFGPTADGNVAPLRFVTTPGMDDALAPAGIAVDSSGTIYVNAYSASPATVQRSSSSPRLIPAA